MSLSFTLTIGPVIKSSFNTLLRLHEVMQTNGLSRCPLTFGQKPTPLKNTLDSTMARLDRLRLQDDSDGLWGENWHEQRVKLFKWVFKINYNLPSRSFSTSTLRLIRDVGNVLYDCINTEGYKESQDDIQIASRIAEDIRDALIDYQVCSDKPYATGVQLKLGYFDR